jgi:uncharacterized repeat protein (TIGR01451 family)
VEILKPERPPGPPALPPTAPSPPARPAGEALLLRAIALTNPVHPGGTPGYEIRLTNNGTVPYRKIVITATVPPGMTPSALGTVGATVDGQKIQFDPVAELAPGKTLTCRARVLAKQLGKYHLRVEMTTSDPPTQMAVDSDETEVSN